MRSTAEVRSASASEVGAPTTVAAAGKVPSTAAPAPAAAEAAVLRICQSRRTRYRDAEQQGPDESNEMPYFVHCFHSVPARAALQKSPGPDY